MKRVLTLLLLVFYITAVKATNCEPRIFQEEKINLEICDNYDYSGERLYILFEARTKVLNDYIKDKIARGELQDKKFEFSIYPSFFVRYLNLTQEENSYLVGISGIPYPTLAQLMTVVDYFAKPDWEPFTVEVDRPKRDDETVEAAKKRYEADNNKIHDFFKSAAGYVPHAYQPFTVWKRDGISLEYSGDSLRYLIGKKPLLFQVNATLPVKIKDRYLFFEREQIFVVQDMRIIKTHKIEELLTGDYKVHIHSNWVNIYETYDSDDEDRWDYSYSYDKNQFYEHRKYQNTSQ